MSMILQGGPFKAPVAGFHRFTVAQYHKMIEAGVLTEDDRVELLEGYLVEKMPHDPLHDGTLQKVNRRLTPLLPPGWELRVQMSITLLKSEPEPDIAVVREDPSGYMTRHPGPADFGVLAEVANTSLDSDRDDKLPIYARAGIPVYWIVNVVDRQVEVYEQPSGPTASPGYGVRQVYKPGDLVPLVLDGVSIGPIPVADLLR
jgi:Uma2 family endonuclease